MSVSFDLMNPPPNGLVVFAVAPEYCSAVEASLDAAGAVFELAKGMYQGKHELCYVMHWEDYTRELADTLYHYREEVVLLVHPYACYIVSTQDIDCEGSLVVQVLKPLTMAAGEPEGDYTLHNSMYYYTEPSLEKNV